MSINQTIRKTIGKSTIILSAIAFSNLCASATPVMANPDFSGEWNLNEQKSELGQFGRMAARTMKVENKEGGLAIERHSTNMTGEAVTLNEKLTFDGKETESSIPNIGKKTSTAKWSEDGQTLNVNSTISGNNGGQSFEIKQTQAWKLLDGGKSLLIESTSVSPLGTSTTKLMYEKATK